ncbi:MAG: class I SAM-dependent methyltransferase [Gemmatimonadetes bacterium]|jgi:hypothetical protein|nr:class I SAM-dependent methyltransferase [Gemmatimonadota bacterium]MBT4609081.1 class I SAM-dependent methyltransferase [Gemmatimonadota bacterium]MBT5057898.1 class I SAM-dependent methyltransferase [Gemmatimonadota bacterium]MBT5144338.1 class I SAM-dependent methyltransferase [Gemmatimonadota bacterium]MBT5589997.1 class I SAM-dependent methyltransferase [Gemmatimonadota bacterium]
MPESDERDLPPLGAQDYSETQDWPSYFGAVLGKGPRATLTTALDSFTREGVADGLAVDVAAGEGRDTLELLQRGWRVVATDFHAEAFTHLWPRVPESQKQLLTALQVSFEETHIPPCDLVNASYAFPFCEPRHFGGLWDRVVAAIRPGGRLAGQFFGKEDSWAALPGRTHHDRDEIMQLLEGFQIEMMEVEEADDTPDVRNPKHWQLFHVVAKKL